MEKEFMYFRAKGSFFAEIRKNGKVIETIEKHNLVVNTSCQIIAKLLAGAVVSPDAFDNQISKIKCGVDNESTSYPDDMISSIDKTNLDGTVYEKNIINSDGTPNTQGGGISNIIYDDSNAPNDVIYQFYIGTSEWNRPGGGANNIWEFGLFSQGDIMFSMLSRRDMGKEYAIVKDESVDISGYWKIQIRNTSV